MVERDVVQDGESLPDGDDTPHDQPKPEQERAEGSLAQLHRYRYRNGQRDRPVRQKRLGRARRGGCLRRRCGSVRPQRAQSYEQVARHPAGIGQVGEADVVVLGQHGEAAVSHG